MSVAPKQPCAKPVERWYQVPDIGISMVMLGVGGTLLLAAAAYSDFEHWRRTRR